MIVYGLVRMMHRYAKRSMCTVFRPIVYACFVALLLLISLLFLGVKGTSASSRSLNIYNWSDYIADDTIANFYKKTGISTRYDVYDSNDILQAKLLAGQSGYDIVMPSSHYVSRQIKMKTVEGGGLFRFVDKNRIPNLKNLDPALMKKVAYFDPGNQRTVPWAFGTTGLGYRVERVRQILGEDASLDTWDNLFDPKIISQLNQCKVSVLDAPDQMFAAALHYLGLNPSSNNPADYHAAFELLKKIRPHITQFSSSTYINDLVAGDVCFAFGFSGDIMIARERSKQANKPYQIKYLIPKTGAPIWFDLMAIPADAQNVDEALEWINYSQDPKVNAATTDKVFYPSVNKAARRFVRSDIANDSNIYPSEAVIEKLFPLTAVDPKISRLMTRLWTRFKTNK